MTYGVDQCRVCGTPIKPDSPESYDEHMEALRKPPIPESQWRKLGFLAPPTRKEWNINPALGCCGDCAIEALHRRYRFNYRGVAVVLVAIVVGAFVIVITSAIRQ